MSSAPLPHVYPTLGPPEGDEHAPLEEYVQRWEGRMRIVSRQRARALRRRGVPIMRSIEVTTRGQHRHAWFVEAP